MKDTLGPCSVFFMKRLSSLEVQNVLSRYEILHLGPLNLSLYGNGICPLYRVSFIIGSTVLISEYPDYRNSTVFSSV